jgi:hypothetical protein
MIQCGGGAGFTLKSFQSRAVLRKPFGQKFQGDLTAEPGVFGFIHHAHAAIGELLHEEEMRKRFWYVHCSRLFN